MHYRIASAQQHSGPVPSLGDTVTVESDVGPLYIRQDDTIIKPYLEEHGNWAPEQALTVRETVGSGMCFLDIGAHVGYFSVLSGALVGPDGVVFAFEPHPRNYELLLANVWRNGLTNVVCFPWAVGDRNGFAELFEAPGNSGDHRLYRSAGEDRDVVRVRCVALDALGAIRTPVDFVKLDVQGAEEGAMRGMEQVLALSPDVTVAVEFWPYGMARFGTDVRGVLPYYRSLGYRIRAHHPDRDRPVELADDEILGLCDEWDGFGHADLVLRREWNDEAAAQAGEPSA